MTTMTTFLMWTSLVVHLVIIAMTTTMTAFGMLPIQTMITMACPTTLKTMTATHSQDSLTTTMTAYPTMKTQMMTGTAFLTSLNRE